MKEGGTISNDLDSFRNEILIIGAAILALIFNHEFALLEIAWTFSVYLESVAILPQLSVTSQGKSSDVDKVILFYLSSLASHKIFYILNWMYRYNNEGFYDIIAMSAGVVQAAIYVNFFVMFIIKKFAEMKIETSV